mgnify:CR=1 FL=1
MLIFDSFGTEKQLSIFMAGTPKNSNSTAKDAALAVEKGGRQGAGNATGVEKHADASGKQYIKWALPLHFPIIRIDQFNYNLFYKLTFFTSCYFKFDY